jgi:hypothetical protein
MTSLGGFTPLPLCFWRKVSQCPLNTILGESLSRFGCFGEEKQSFCYWDWNHDHSDAQPVIYWVYWRRFLRFSSERLSFSQSLKTKLNYIQGFSSYRAVNTFCRHYKTIHFILYREIIAVTSEIQTKHINTLCGQHVEFLNVKPDGKLHTFHSTLKVTMQ